MPTSKSLRLYVNEKRVSTAVRVKDCSILQVYPVHQRFANEDDWRSYWEMNPICKPVLRVEGTMPLASTKTPGSSQRSFRCAECLLDGSFDHRNCIVLRFDGNVEEWEAASLTKRDELQAAVASEAAQSKGESKPWTCPACGKGPGNDHRMCICRSYNFSVTLWEEACGIRNRED
jgi:hypothetical protein